MHQGDQVASVYAIRSGLVKTYDINKEGEEKPLVYDGPDELFPNSYIYSRSAKALYYYQAYTDCKLSLVPKPEYLTYLKANPELLFATLCTMADRYLDFSRRINGLTQLRAEEKVLYALDFLSRRFGDKRNPRDVHVDIPLSQQELANFVGLTRETVNLAIKTLRKKGVIRQQDTKGLRIDIQAIDKQIEI